MIYSNIFYFRKISAIGGTEQFLYEIAKKYHSLDITVFYMEADYFQLMRLKRLVRCIKWVKGMKIECINAFFNFNNEIIDDVIAKEYIFISHANYEELGYKPPINHPKYTKFIGVSDFCTNKLDEYAKRLGLDVKTGRCYNPLTVEKPKKVLKLISATRLDDVVKGGQRTIMLINALDKYCRKHDRQYLWTIFTNKTSVMVDSPNVCFMKGRVDIRPYIADSDYLVQLSNDMETYCYSINEALSYGVPVITTPLSIMKELPVTDEMHIECRWDMGNADYVAKHIFESERKKFTYIPPKDDWDNLLVNNPSTYTPEKEKEKDMGIRVVALKTYSEMRIMDAELGVIPTEGFTFEVSEERLKVLLGSNKYKKAFVVRADTLEKEKVEEPKEEVKAPKKKGRKKKE